MGQKGIIIMLNLKVVSYLTLLLSLFMSWAAMSVTLQAPEVIILDEESLSKSNKSPSISQIVDYLDHARAKLQDANAHETVKPFLIKLKTLFQTLLQEKDGHGPFFIALIDDMRVNAGVLPLDKGANLVFLNTGLLRFIKNDDELAGVLGHELEHLTSRLQNEVNRLDALGEDLKSGLLQRTVENEVDAKSVMTRPKMANLNPYAYLDLLKRLKLKDTEVSLTHTDAASRVHTSGLALAFQVREQGENGDYRLSTNAVTTEIVEPIRKQFLNTKAYVAPKLRELYSYLSNPSPIGVQQVYNSFLKGETETKTYNITPPTSYDDDFKSNINYLKELGYDDLSREEQVNVHLRLHKGLMNVYEKVRLQLLGPNFHSRDFEELKKLNLADNRNLRLPVPEILSVQQRINELSSEIKTTESRITTTSDMLFKEHQLMHLEEQKKKMLKLKADLVLAQLPYSALATDADGKLKKYGARAGYSLYNTPVAMLDFGFKPKYIDKEINRYRNSHIQTLKNHLDLYRNEFKSYTRVRYILDPLIAAGVNPKEYGEVFALYFDDVKKYLAKNNKEYANEQIGEMLRRWWYEPTPNGNTMASAFTQYAKVEPQASEEVLSKIINTIVQNISFTSEFGDFLKAFKNSPFIDVRHKENLKLFESLESRLEKVFLLEVERATKFRKLITAWEVYQEIFENLKEVLPKFSSRKINLSPTSYKQFFLKAKALVRASSDGDLIHLILFRLPNLAHALKMNEPSPLPLANSLLRLASDPGINGKRLEGESEPFPLNEILPFMDIYKKFGRTLTLEKFHHLVLGTSKIIDFSQNIYVDSPDFLKFVKDYFQYVSKQKMTSSGERTQLFPLMAKVSESLHYSESEIVMDVFRKEFLLIYKLNENLTYQDQIIKSVSRFIGDLNGSYGLAKDELKLTKSFWTPILPKDPLKRLNFAIALLQGLDVAHQEESVREGLKFSITFDGFYSKQFVSYASKYFDFNVLKDLLNIKDLVKIGPVHQLVELFDLNVRVFGATPASDDLLLELLVKLKDMNIFSEKRVMDKSIFEKVYYQATKIKLAKWQLNQKFYLNLEQVRINAGVNKKIGLYQERPIISDIFNYITERFSEANEVTHELVKYVENTLVTTEAETKRLATFRLNTNDNWVQEKSLMAIDTPQFFDKFISSQQERYKILLYLIGNTDQPPYLSKLHRTFKEEFAKEQLVQLKRKFVMSDSLLRIYLLQPLLDSTTGLLSEAETTKRVDELVLGEFIKNKVILKIYKSYLKALPESERMAVLGRVFSTRAGSTEKKSSSLKSLLEALGPFGIRVGQFLRTSGMIPADQRKDLDNFFDNALKPERDEVIKKLKTVFGTNITFVEYLGSVIGSGSINYIVLANILDPITGKSNKVTIQVSRENIGNRIENENAIWEKVSQELMRDSDFSVRQAVTLLNEARAHAFEKLKPGGSELNGRYSRGLYPEANRVYSKSRPILGGLAIDVAKPNLQLQKLVSSEFQDSVSIYEYIPNTRFFDLPTHVKSKVADMIVNAELRALFTFGVFDPDGHPGNWLYNADKGRIVRIDFPQLTKIPPNSLANLKEVFAALTSGSLNNFTIKKLVKNAKLLFTIKSLDWKSFNDVQAIESELLEVLNQMSKSAVLPPASAPHERVLMIQQELQKALNVKFQSHVFVSLNEDLRSALSSLGRIAIYAEYLPPKRFEKLFAMNIGLSAVQSRIHEIIQSPKMALSCQKIF